MSLIHGQHVPMSHQLADVLSLQNHCRVNIWNGLGTGKMNTGAWLALQWYLRGVIDELVVVLPSMCAPDWIDTFTHLAWPENLADVWDCRPPNALEIKDALTSGTIPEPGRLRVMLTTYAGLRKVMDERDTGTSSSRRYKTDVASAFMCCVRGRRLGVIFDEAQAGALNTQQGTACAMIAAGARAVQSMSATPIGNPKQMRLWGMTRLVRPDVLSRIGAFESFGYKYDNVVKFEAFKARYAFLYDPTLEGRLEKNPKSRMIVSRAFPTDIKTDLIQAEIVDAMAPFTVQRRKEDCLDLPEKIFNRRSYVLPAKAERMMQDLIEDDRAVMEDGGVVTVENVLTERLRTLELCGGYLAGIPVHDGKLVLLRDVVKDIHDNLGKRVPLLTWASRTRELIACALTIAGEKPNVALNQAADCLVEDGEGSWKIVQHEYASALRRARANGVELIHGPTPLKERDRIQADWRAGRILHVCAHPGVAGAGLNWQHVRATVYFSPPLGTIARSQSEDRVHRKGLKHLALYYDLVTEGGPDEAVYQAHRSQRDSALAMLDWMHERSVEYHQ
jgi:hypothetical protein